MHNSVWGTKLPVVRATAFRPENSLINLPTRRDARVALRIYAFHEDTLDGELVRVSIYANDERLLAETTLALRGIPRYASILSLVDTFPEIALVERVRVHVLPLRPEVRIWSFASVTSNATQHVSLITPD